MSHKSLLHHTHSPGWKDTSSISTTLLFAHTLSQWSDWQLRLNLCPESNYRVGWGECSIWARLQSHLPRNQDSVTGELQLHKASQAWPQTRGILSSVTSHCCEVATKTWKKWTQPKCKRSAMNIYQTNLQIKYSHVSSVAMAMFRQE